MISHSQEERELSDMEVSLHRTRSLLGEKVIHLKHLEQSLERVANDKRNENDASSTKNDELTLSDMSSASSGFSSTDLGTDTFVGELQTKSRGKIKLLFNDVKVRQRVRIRQVSCTDNNNYAV